MNLRLLILSEISFLFDNIFSKWLRFSAANFSKHSFLRVLNLHRSSFICFGSIFSATISRSASFVIIFKYPLVKMLCFFIISLSSISFNFRSLESFKIFNLNFVELILKLNFSISLSINFSLSRSSFVTFIEAIFLLSLSISLSIKDISSSNLLIFSFFSTSFNFSNSSKSFLYSLLSLSKLPSISVIDFSSFSHSFFISFNFLSSKFEFLISISKFCLF